MIIVVGVAGSGKSTQSKMLAEKEGWCWISMGQLLRNTLTGDLADEMNSGKLLDDTKVTKILKDELSLQVQHCKVILDGFPRRVVQAEWLIGVVAELGDTIEAIVHLNAKEEIVLGRLLQRGRPDDKPDAINERFLEYEQDIKPLLQLFAASGVPIVEVNGEQDKDIVQAAIRDGLEHAGIAL
jgi:adenylate kinase